MRVRRVRLSAADHVYWRRPGAISYRGTLAEWPRFLAALIEREGVTDLLCYADRPPYHAAATRVAAELGIVCHIVENGYLRPDWITLERGGMSAYSHFPEDPESIRRIARDMPDPDFEVRYRHSFSLLAMHEVINDLSNRFDPLLHPHFETDKYYDPVVDFLSWVPRLFHAPRLRRAAAAVEKWDPTTRFWLLAMQLQSDYQIRANSHYRHLSEMLDEVISSFAAHARREDRLVVKLHPHDNGLERWDRIAERLAGARGVSGRVHTILGGDLGRLLGRSQGVVVVNSTVGIHTIRARKPLKVLGSAVYDLPGLTHQGALDTFWTEPEAPEPGLVDDFVRALAGSIQLKGDFYDVAGRAAAIAEITESILSGHPKQTAAFVDPPPRLARLSARRALSAERGSGP